MNNQNSLDASADAVYLNLVNSYITTSREILNGYITFEHGLVRNMNNRLFRNFNFTSTTGTAAGTAAGTASTERTRIMESTFETPIPVPQMGTIRVPATPSRPANPTSFHIPTPVRLTTRLYSPTTPATATQLEQPNSQSIQRHVSLFQQQQERTNATTTPATRVALEPPFSSTFVRYNLPIPLGPRRVPYRSPSPESSSPRSPSPVSPIQPENTHTHTRAHPETPPSLTRSLSPILPPHPFRSSRADNFNLLNFMNTATATATATAPSLNDSLIYYTQVIDRELHLNTQRQQEQERQQRGLNYDIIQQQTKIIPYCTITNPLNDVCPISQLQFDVIDCVMQINICKHNFNPYSLIRWLDANSTCPMCRQNIDIGGNSDNDVNGNENMIYNNEDSDYSSMG